jgi:hypothetical protein
MMLYHSGLVTQNIIRYVLVAHGSNANNDILKEIPINSKRDTDLKVMDSFIITLCTYIVILTISDTVIYDFIRTK